MGKLSEIATGWKNFLSADQETKEEAKRRLDICDGCDSKQQLSKTGQLILSVLNDQASTYRCGECGCPLSAKSLSPESKCPLGKWEKNAHDHDQITNQVSVAVPRDGT